MITTPEKVMLRENLHYLQPMLDSNHRNSLWYGGDVLTINYKGYDLTLCANGDVICDYQHSKDDSLIQVNDKSNHAIFLEQLKNAIPNDEALKNLLLEAASGSETLWDCAKALSVSPESVLAQNPDVTFPLSKGEKVFVFRSAGA